MQRLLIGFVFFLLSFSLMAQESPRTEQRFLDGFTIRVENGYELSEDEYVWIESARRELSEFSIATPKGNTVYGTVLYDIGLESDDIKDDLFPMIRYIYRDHAKLDAREAVALLPEDGEAPMFLFYYAIGNLEFTGFVVLLDDSPGFATACIFSIHDTNIPADAQADEIDKLINNLRFSFDEAAG